MQHDPESPDSDEELEVAVGGESTDGIVIVNDQGGPIMPGQGE